VGLGAAAGDLEEFGVTEPVGTLFTGTLAVLVPLEGPVGTPGIGGREDEGVTGLTVLAGGLTEVFGGGGLFVDELGPVGTFSPVWMSIWTSISVNFKVITGKLTADLAIHLLLMAFRAA
jgi:hypothetical protein